jgi:hypothetical protein
MAAPALGSLSLRSLRREVSNNNYNAGNTHVNISLKNLATGVNGTINRANTNANKPDAFAPHAMSEFYKYDHDGSVGTSPASFSQATAAAQNANRTITVTTADYSTWQVSSKPSWVSTNVSNGTGAGSVVLSMSANTGGARQGNVVITFTIGTALGTHPNGSNTFTTRSTTVSQAAGSDDGGNEGLGDGGGEDP